MCFTIGFIILNCNETDHERNHIELKMYHNFANIFLAIKWFAPLLILLLISISVTGVFLQNFGFKKILIGVSFFNQNWFNFSKKVLHFRFNFFMKYHCLISALCDCLFFFIIYLLEIKECFCFRNIFVL